MIAQSKHFQCAMARGNSLPLQELAFVLGWFLS
ncbi:hypothetical protein PUATCC27989T_04542 [Phytobacter ursingii]|nr:hypothetical protein PUATCC27989T_04542 [Phytobacter ursingii]